MKPNIDITKRISPAEFLKAELEMGIDIQNEAFYNLCKHTAEQIADLGIKTVLDYGAGTGVYAEAYRRLGYKVYAFEIWEEHREYIRKNTQVELVNMIFTTDLLNFIEVAEHMYDKELDSLFELIKPKYVLFSSTSDVSEWDLAWGHVNIKFQDEWIRFFESKGYEYLRPLQYPTNYTKLFKLK